MTNNGRGREVDTLVHEMERVDMALGQHLSEHLGARLNAGPGTPALEYARLQVQAWCTAAAHRGDYDVGVLAATLHAIETMTRAELVAFLRSLLGPAGGADRSAA
ncbi:MAG: hypothetical protein ACYC28_12845 [Longimicrobiales bacterium]